MKVYLAGPMRGIPDWNFPTFDEAEKRFREAGHVAFSPAQIDRALGYNSTVEADPSHLRHVILGDIVCIFHADAIALLPGWEGSSGATVELALAQFLGLKILSATTMEEIYPTVKPWTFYTQACQPGCYRFGDSHAHQDAERQHGIQGDSDWGPVWRDTYRRYTEQSRGSPPGAGAGSDNV